MHMVKTLFYYICHFVCNFLLFYYITDCFNSQFVESESALNRLRVWGSFWVYERTDREKSRTGTADNWTIKIFSQKDLWKKKKTTSRQPLPERSHCSTRWCPVSDFALSTPLCQDFDAGLQADRTKEAPHHSPYTIHSVCPKRLPDMVPLSHT